MILDNNPPSKKLDFHPTHKWFLVSGILFFILSIFFGFRFGNTAIDIQIHDTYFVIALFYITLAFGILFLFYALAYYLLNISLKKTLHKGWSNFHFVVSLLTILCGFYIILKSSNQFQRYFVHLEEVTTSQNSMIDLIWIVLLVFFASQCIFILNIIRSVFISIWEK